MLRSRVQVGDIKPIGPVWPNRSIDRVKHQDKDSKRDDEQRDRRPRDEDEDKDGSTVDEYA